ncbi:MAG: DUF5343 domain-containing protein [Rhizomicrobium sp.]|jgi:hypothetical protein
MSDTAEVKATPPYTSFPSFKTLLKNLKEHGIPTRIDRSVLGGSFSNAVGSQLLTALKFLELTDDNNQPTKNLKPLVDELGTEEWKTSLLIVLEAAYPPLFALNLENASAAQFNERFRSAYKGTDDVQQKSVRFFLSAARDAGVKLSPYIMKNKKPRSATAKKRVPKISADKSKSGAGGGKNTDTTPTPHPPSSQNKQPSEMLLSLFDAKMDKGEQEALWLLIKHFKGKGQ